MEKNSLPYSRIWSSEKDYSRIIELDGPAVWSFSAVNSPQVATDWFRRF
jgi:hypothetical protein